MLKLITNNTYRPGLLKDYQGAYNRNDLDTQVVITNQLGFAPHMGEHWRPAVHHSEPLSLRQLRAQFARNVQHEQHRKETIQRNTQRKID